MSSFSLLTINCPHCGHINSITTNDLPYGTLLGCSHCRREVAQWNGGETGFQPLPLENATRQGLAYAGELAPTL